MQRFMESKCHRYTSMATASLLRYQNTDKHIDAQNDVGQNVTSQQKHSLIWSQKVTAHAHRNFVYFSCLKLKKLFFCFSDVLTPSFSLVTKRLSPYQIYSYLVT